MFFKYTSRTCPTRSYASLGYGWSYYGRWTITFNGIGCHFEFMEIKCYIHAHINSFLLPGKGKIQLAGWYFKSHRVAKWAAKPWQECLVGVGSRSPVFVTHFGGSATFYYFHRVRKKKKEKTVNFGRHARTEVLSLRTQSKVRCVIMVDSQQIRGCALRRYSDSTLLPKSHIKDDWYTSQRKY